MANIIGHFSSRATATDNFFFTLSAPVPQGLTVTDVINDILLLWGITPAAYPAKTFLARAVHDMNAALQMVWSLAKDANYFSRQTLTLAFTTGQSSQTLPENVLTILGPARYTSNGQPLSPISSRAQYDAFGPIFLGNFTYSVPNGAPAAFWVEKLNTSQPDNVTNILHIVPAPSAGTSFNLDVSVDAPRYVWNDYVKATPIQFPHRYADSVLLPFCRYKAMTSFLLTEPDLRPSLVADYQTALKIIGAVDPAMKEVEFAERATDRAAA
jgi:hypothetical protein